MSQYDTLLKAAHDSRIKRNKIPLETSVLARLLYLAWLSYRAMTYQTEIIPGMHWAQKLKGITSKVQRKHRRFVAIDETMQKVNGRQHFV